MGAVEKVILSSMKSRVKTWVINLWKYKLTDKKTTKKIRHNNRLTDNNLLKDEQKSDRQTRKTNGQSKQITNKDKGIKQTDKQTDE